MVVAIGAWRQGGSQFGQVLRPPPIAAAPGQMQFQGPLFPAGPVRAQPGAGGLRGMQGEAQLTALLPDPRAADREWRIAEQLGQRIRRLQQVRAPEHRMAQNRRSVVRDPKPMPGDRLPAHPVGEFERAGHPGIGGEAVEAGLRGVRGQTGVQREAGTVDPDVGEQRGGEPGVRRPLAELDADFPLRLGLRAQQLRRPFEGPDLTCPFQDQAAGRRPVLPTPTLRQTRVLKHEPIRETRVERKTETPPAAARGLGVEVGDEIGGLLP